MGVDAEVEDESEDQLNNVEVGGPFHEDDPSHEASPAIATSDHEVAGDESESDLDGSDSNVSDVCFSCHRFYYSTADSPDALGYPCSNCHASEIGA